MKLTKWEEMFLKYYQKNYNAKWIKVYNNNHVILETQIELYNVFKRRLKNQPQTEEVTYPEMLKELTEDKFYKIDELLEKEGEEIV